MTQRPPGYLPRNPTERKTDLLWGYDLVDLPELGPSLIETGQALTFTRATLDTALGLNGLLVTAVSGQPLFEYVDTNADAIRDTLSRPLESARTNVVLQNRDLTNAAWTKTNVTALKNQIGIDGVANSASKITASAANGTCLQAITLASSARYQTAYVKRLVGAGTVNMTTDNGVTWPAVTVTTGWTRVSIPSQTLANPTVGFRLVTNGDAIAVDYVQNENGAYPTSAIATAAGAVTRNPDTLTSTADWEMQDFTVYWKINRPIWASFAGDLGNKFTIIALSATNPRIEVYYDQTTRATFALIHDGTTQQLSPTAAIPAGNVLEGVAQFVNMLSAPQVKVDVGSGYGALSTADVAIPAFGGNGVGIGDALLTTGNPLNGNLIALRVRGGAWTLADMQGSR